MGSFKGSNRHSVFLNVPFDQAYEPLFVALISVLAAVGRIPRCVLEIPEVGQGRLARILRLIKSCQVSIHDLSRAGVPARFNMPFELGIAVALCRYERRHKFIVLEAKRHRLDVTLSDLKAIDPLIHNGSVKAIISCVLACLGKPADNPTVNEVLKTYHQLWKTAIRLVKAHHRPNIYSRSIFNELVAGAFLLAQRTFDHSA